MEGSLFYPPSSIFHFLSSGVNWIITMPNVLFLCTGNYYRSRFAEELFNARAAKMGLDWQASSRGLATEFGAGNIGPISALAVNRLIKLGVDPGDNLRFPLPLRESELAEADLIIALYEAEHRPYLKQRFPDWPDNVEYWHIPDLGEMPADKALAKIEREIEALINRLNNSL